MALEDMALDLLKKDKKRNLEITLKSVNLKIQVLRQSTDLDHFLKPVLLHQLTNCVDETGTFT